MTPEDRKLMQQLRDALVRSNNTLMSAHGCCADKACNASTCMALPVGKTCGDCVHREHCFAMYAHKPTDTYCDFFPRRFREKQPEKQESRHAVE